MSFKDGFVFGMGFFIAGIVLSIVASLAGMVLFGGILASMMSAAGSY